MSRTKTLLALAAGALLAIAAFGPGAAIADEFETNQRWCDEATDWDLAIEACTWLLHSGRLAQESVPIVLYNRGVAWRHKGEYDRAIEDYTAALRIKPDYHEALNNRGHAWYCKGEYDRAIEDYTAALRIKPDLHQALYNRGIAWRRKGEHDRAIEDYTAALRIKPDLHQTLSNRGQAWYHKGEHDRALEDYTAALRIKPDYHQALNGLAWLLATAPEARARDGQRAVSLAEKSVSLQDDANNRDTLAAAYAEAGRFVDAVGAQKLAVSMARAEGLSAEDLAEFEERLHLYRAGRPYRKIR